MDNFNVMDPPPANRRNEWVFWIFAAVTLFLFLGHNALWGSEDRWAEIAREMILTGNFLHPAINWQVYFDKPQLSYWLIVPFAWLQGGMVTELTARLPSALAALAALYGTLMLGKKLFDRRTALLAVWMMLTCYGFLFWARTAAADIANVAAIILAVAVFYQVEDRARFPHYLGFYLICFLGALTKGLPALVMPFVIIAPHLITESRWKKHLKFSNFCALVVAAAAYFVPFYLASIQPLIPPQQLPPGEALSGLELVWRENVVRVFNAFDHKDPFYSYFYNLPRILLPWVLLIGVPIAGMVRNWKKLPPQVRELMIGSLLMFLLFTCSTSRRWYYILPLIPFCCLLGSAGLTDNLGVARWNRTAVIAMRIFAIVAASLGIVSLIGIPLWRRFFDFNLPLIALFAVPAAGLLGLFVMLLDNQPHMPMERLTGLPRRLAATVVTIAILVAAILSCVYPSLTMYRAEKPFYLAFREAEPDIAPEQILFWKYTAAPKMLFYLNYPRPLMETPNNAFAEDFSAEEVEKMDPELKRELSYQRNLKDLHRFLTANAGRKVAIVSFDRNRDLLPLERAVAEIGLPLDVETPDLSERDFEVMKSKQRKLLLWVIEAPLANQE